MQLEKRTPKELKNLLANNAKHGQHETVRLVLLEMSKRGIATARDYRFLEWNQESVKRIMKPFKDIAVRVQGNLRTDYTEAGGSKIGRRMDDPQRLWIDTYSAIKASNVNAAFACLVRQPGDEPTFRLIENGTTTLECNADGIAGALEEWQRIAKDARQAHKA